ncbi:MAG: hypothetical protein F7B20_02190 [Aeropyrum sp.]|nr:hypothetical protein [Aeropyrum sp.]
MGRVVSFKWFDGGFAVISAEGGGVKIQFSNLEMVIGLREISLSGVFEKLWEHPLDKRNKSKAVYIEFAFPLKGLPRPEGVVFQDSSDTYIGAYGISYTPLNPASSYITIYPPPGALYDYLTISPDKAAMFTIFRRHVYTMREDGTVKILLL